MSNEQIIEVLRHPGNEIPREELAEVVRRREEFVPILIAEIETATRLGADADLDDSLASFALYLLAEMRESRAVEPILNFFALDETTEVDLFGDMITQNGADILAAVARDNPGALREYAKREDISQWVRNAALDALVRQVLNGERLRESVVQFFAELIDQDEFAEDQDAWTGLVSACLDLHPRELLSRIRKLYERELVDPWVVGELNEIEAEAAEDLAAHQERYRSMHEPITDAADAVSWWESFNPEWQPDDLRATTGAMDELQKIRALEELDGPVIDLPAEPIRSAPKVGRNDLCPCGSGKKYKKCCLGKG